MELLSVGGLYYVTISLSVQAVREMLDTIELNQFLKVKAEHLLILSKHHQKVPNENFTKTIIM